MGAVKSITHSFKSNQYLFWYIQRKESQNIIQLLNSQPQLINCDLTVNYKTTPLHRVCLLGNFQLVKLLIEKYKADPNFKTTNGETPLMAAAKRDREEIVQYLLDNEANPDIISTSGLTALDYAILQGNYECAQEINKRVKVTKMKNPYEYFEICYKYKYRWVDYEIIVDGIEKGIPRQNVRDFLKKPKKKYVDPVVDPRETWKAWIWRNMEFQDPPMVERSDLPEDLQPQNQNFAKLRHFMTRMTISPLVQKPNLYPRTDLEAQSDIKMNEINSQFSEKMEVKSAA